MAGRHESVGPLFVCNGCPFTPSKQPFRAATAALPPVSRRKNTKYSSNHVLSIAAFLHPIRWPFIPKLHINIHFITKFS